MGLEDLSPKQQRGIRKAAEKFKRSMEGVGYDLAGVSYDERGRPIIRFTQVDNTPKPRPSRRR